MKPSLDKLKKFLKLEADRGYDNRAVLGGLEQMLDPWVAEARADDLPNEVIEAVISRLRDYHRLSEASRQETLQGLRQRIQREISPPSPPSPLPTEEEQPKAQPSGKEAISTQPKRPEPSPKPEAKPQPRKKKPSEAPTSHTPKGAPAALDAPTTVLSGVGPNHANTLKRLGLETLGDMLYFFPRRYDDYSRLKPINHLEFGDEVTIIATVQSAANRRVRSGRTTLTEAIVSDGTGSLRITWFNQPWIKKSLRNGLHVVLSGKIDQYLGRLGMNNPELETVEQHNLHTHRIVPVYPLTQKITQRWLRRMMYQVVTYWAPRVNDPLPEHLRQAARLVDLPTALLQCNFPDSWKQLKNARHRLAFEEILLLQLGLLAQKHTWQERTARVFNAMEDWLKAQIKRLPFTLTKAQQRAIKDLRSDLASGHPMNRLLQGDVGSGKTVIAALGIVIVVHHGAQAALMAPTSILAEQHFNSLRKLLTGVDGVIKETEIQLMIGATPEAEKRSIREGLANGQIKVVIGTHALIEEPVVFSELQLVVVDEQHRFGVEQRASLRNKGENPHLLVMTATPIPRSLALTVYGDLDLSVMDEMPPGRQKVDTHVLNLNRREQAYSLIRDQLEQGRQAFIIYPLVEEQDRDSPYPPEPAGRGAVEEHERLQKEIFPSFDLGLLHGRLKPYEKENVMSRFRDGENDLLVSTSVVEVGVDIPNATVMLIEGANRFGLAQLHQFRGRVGRGPDKAYCLLIPESEDTLENERLAAMVETNDGFVLAERDLEQRGPGDFLGTRQSGFLALRMASLTDVKLIEKARRFAKEIFNKDPDLDLPEHHLLAASLHRFWGENGQKGGGDIS